MRPLESKADLEKKERRNRKIMVGFLAFVLLAGTLGIAFQNQVGGGTVAEPEAEYNGHNFVNRNGFWVYESYIFSYLPQQVPTIGAEIRKAESYEGLPVYIYSESLEAETEIFANLGQIALRIQKACPAGETCAASVPEKTCSDNFIIIKEGSNNAITQENGCVYIQGRQEDLVALADEFMFKVLGIK